MRKIITSVLVAVLLCVGASFGWTVEGSATNARIGYTCASAGDVNGDGYIDAIFTDYNAGSPTLKVFYGNAFGLSATADNTISVSSTVSTVASGSTKNNGYSDVAFKTDADQTVYLSYGTSSGLNTPTSICGSATSITIGDVNGDSYADLFVGRSDSIYCYYGSASGIPGTPSHKTSGTTGGSTSMCVANLNGDGYNDLIIGSPYFANGQINEGNIYVFYGSASGLSATPDLDNEGNVTDGYHGQAVASAGDIDNDGYEDIAVATSGSRTCVYFGQTGSGFKSWTYINSIGNLSKVNVNGDSYSDLLIGNASYNGTEGRIELYEGSSSGISTTASWTYRAGATQTTAALGPVACFGNDLDKDGYGDFIASAPTWTNTYVAAGKAWLFYGSSTGPSATPTVSAVPTLASPDNMASNQSLSTSVKWNKVTRAQTYNLQIATDAGFSSLIADETGLTDTSYAPTLTNDQTYYWKVSSTNEGGTSTWSTARWFSTLPAAPDVPVLTSPDDGATNQPVSVVTLMWDASARAESYTVQASVNSDFSSPILDESTGGTNAHLTSLTNNVTYHWRVKAVNAGGESAWASRSFTTIIALPATPTLASPTNGATGIPVNQTLSWNSATDASGYDIVVSVNNDFSSPILNTSLTGLSQALSSLSNNTTYYWRVRSTNVAGNSDWASRSFTTIVATPGVPVISSPSNGATDVALTPTVTWGSVSGATDYQIQVATNSGFTSPLVDESLTATSKTLSLSNGTVYYVRVNAQNAGGTSAWSSTVSFTTIPNAPGAPVLVSPANNAVNQPVALTLKWNRIAGATYKLQVLNGVLLVADQAGLTDTTYALSGLLNSTAYTWKVSATNAGGTSAWSSTLTFTTIDPVPSAVTILSPADGSTSTVREVTVTWTRPTYADSFHVVIASMIDTTVADTVLSLDLDNAAYTVLVTAKNEAGSATATSGSFTVDVPSTSVRELKTGISFTGASSRSGMIVYTLAKDSRVSLAVYDLAGRTVMAMDRACSAGRYSVSLGRLSRGSYVIAFKAKEYQKKSSMIIF